MRKKVLVGGPARNAKRIVLAGGCFDLIHFGHIHFLKLARKKGDYLVVALESDKNVKRLKGKGRPVHSQKQRKLMLESLRFVDEVIALPPMKTDADYRRLVLRVGPKILAVTARDPHLAKKKRHAEAVGAKVVEIRKLRVKSTSDILTAWEKNNY